MKYIDNFLKILKTDRNTFATYVLTLITVYLAVDRIVEMLFMVFTGVSISYWGPIQYTLALACPVFAYLFAPSSSFGKVKSEKVTLFYTFVIGLYIIALSMFTQWLNAAAWLLLISVPNYVDIITNFSNLVQPAFTALALYLPLVTFMPMIKWIILGVDDSKDMTRSLWDYKGISLSDTSKNHGAFTCDMFMFKDKESGKSIHFHEEKRYSSFLVCGGSGTGKTSLVFEPMIAKDLERKFFFREMGKEMGFTALKTGIATLNCPYDNDYLNENFSLNMITPTFSKESVYKTYMSKLILDSSSDKITYKNLGLSILSPDFEIMNHMIKVCKNFKFKYNIIDPVNPDSIGLNPFVYDSSDKIAITISSVLKTMYNDAHHEIEDAYREDVSRQAIENVAILLKEMYPRMHEGMLPNLEDMLKMLTNFELIEKMCEILAANEELAEKYSMQISYFKKNFYSNGVNKHDTEKSIVAAVSQLDNLLRLPGVKSILCNRTNNIDFDKSLANGEINFICSRRGDLGVYSSKAFGIFYLLSMQNAVLRRPGTEKTRVPNFLYIDEFPDYMCLATESIFTMYRKYRVGTTIAIQNITQLDSNRAKSLKDTILSNCANKIFLGGSTPEELDWWSKEFGTKREWTYGASMDMSKLEYDSKVSGVKWAWVPYFQAGKLNSMVFKNGCYKIKLDSGKSQVGEALLNFMDSKYNQPQSVKTYDFTRFSKNTVQSDDSESNSSTKFDFKNVKFDEGDNGTNPVQTDTTDTDFLFDDNDPIISNPKKKK